MLSLSLSLSLYNIRYMLVVYASIGGGWPVFCLWSGAFGLSVPLVWRLWGCGMLFRFKQSKWYIPTSTCSEVRLSQLALSAPPSVAWLYSRCLVSTVIVSLLACLEDGNAMCNSRKHDLNKPPKNGLLNIAESMAHQFANSWLNLLLCILTLDTPGRLRCLIDRNSTFLNAPEKIVTCSQTQVF